MTESQSCKRCLHYNVICQGYRWRQSSRAARPEDLGPVVNNQANNSAGSRRDGGDDNSQKMKPPERSSMSSAGSSSQDDPNFGTSIPTVDQTGGDYFQNQPIGYIQNEYVAPCIHFPWYNSGPLMAVPMTGYPDLPDKTTGPRVIGNIVNTKGPSSSPQSTNSRNRQTPTRMAVPDVSDAEASWTGSANSEKWWCGRKPY